MFKEVEFRAPSLRRHASRNSMIRSQPNNGTSVLLRHGIESVTEGCREAYLAVQTA